MFGGTQIKAVILAAGITNKKYGFPEDSKPKCLFHYQGEVILERQVRVLRNVGINDITIVGGYKIEMIKQFNEEKKLGLKVVYNPTAASELQMFSVRHYGHGAWVAWFDSIRAGVEGLDDDVLLIFSDLLLTEEGVRAVIEYPKRCIVACFDMYKIPRELLPKLRQLEIGPVHTLTAFCLMNNGIKMNISLQDVDCYGHTDEGKRKG